MHRDVKPSNIMMDAQHKRIVLVDFGLCRRFCTTELCTEERYMTGVTGTYRYMAPEVFQKEQYDAKIDVYSGSVVVCFMLTGNVPFANIPAASVIELVARVGLRPDLSSCKNKNLARLMIRAWDMNPKIRPHAHEMEAELQILYDDLVWRKGNRISSKVFSSLLSVSDSFRRATSASVSPVLPRASSDSAVNCKSSKDEPSVTFDTLNRTVSWPQP